MKFKIVQYAASFAANRGPIGKNCNGAVSNDIVSDFQPIGTAYDFIRGSLKIA